MKMMISNEDEVKEAIQIKKNKKNLTKKNIRYLQMNMMKLKMQKI